MNRSHLTFRALQATVMVAMISGTLSCRRPGPETPAAEAAAPASNRPIGCLGRVEAGDGLVSIATRSLGGQPSIVARLSAHEGDVVKAGQVLAALDSERQLAAAARQADARIEVARKRLAQVREGPKPADIAAQQADIDRLEVELASSEREYRRRGSLGESITPSELETYKLRVDSATHALDGARQRLASLKEIRTVDVDLASAELAEALRNAERAAAERDAAVILAPMDGRVVKIYARAGEQVGNEGLLDLAPISPMYVVAEVTESDISRVKPRQRARISGDGLPGPIEGTVERIGTTVLQNQLQPIDPVRFSDARVVNVWIRVDDAAAVANLIHLRVDVVIQP